MRTPKEVVAALREHLVKLDENEERMRQMYGKNEPLRQIVQAAIGKERALIKELLGE